MADFREGATARRYTPAESAVRVRMGPLSIFALVIVISLAVLSALTLSTAHASLSLAQRQANAVSEKYLAEQAGSVFVAEVDAALAQWREAPAGQGAGSAVQAAEQQGEQVGTQAAEQQGVAESARAAEQQGEQPGVAESAQAAEQQGEQPGVAESAQAAEQQGEQPGAQPAGQGAGSAVQAAEQALAGACEAVRQRVSGVSATASMEGDAISAELVTKGGQTLQMLLSVQDDGTYRVDAWVMGGVHNEEQPQGQLLLVE